MTVHPTAAHDFAEAPRALVVYASTHGHTAKIAARIAQSIRADGLDADLVDVDSAAGTDPASYAVVVVGASLHREHHQETITKWVAERRVALEQRPSVFFSVSLTAADDSGESRDATRHCVDEFCERTGWTPGQTICLPGALQYREYDMFTRQLMRLLMHRMGHPTDASHDHDYTDWDAVDRLGRDVAALARTAGDSLKSAA